MYDEVKELLFDTLNKENTRKRNRKIIFWYDSKEEYREFIEELEIENTEIIIFNNNSFWIRYHIEYEEVNKNILIYFPIDRFNFNDNDLLDIETSYSDFIFNPDSTTIRLKDLELSEDCRLVINKYNKFFNNKKRENEFKLFDIEKNVDNIDYIITSILLGLKSINEDDILKSIFKIYFEDYKRYEELFKYGDKEFIFGLFNKTFGSNIKNIDEIDDLYKSLVLTYFAYGIKNIKKIEKYSKYLLINKSTNVSIFINSIMRDRDINKYYNKLSYDIEKEFGIEDLIKDMDIDEYILSDAFNIIDKYIISFIVDKLYNGIDEFDKYFEYIDLRENKYWNYKYINEYKFLINVIKFLKKIKIIENNIKVVDIEKFILEYNNDLYKMDTYYRKIYYYFDNIEEKDMFIELKDKIENIYVNKYISELSIKWSKMMEDRDSYRTNKLVMEDRFYDYFIEPFNDKKDRVIVIVSDGLRYEVAKELNKKLKLFSDKADIKYMLGVVPSYTELGMAALLPHKVLSKDSNDKIFVDGMDPNGIKNRNLILKKENEDSIAIKYDELYENNKMEWKKMFSGKKVVYIYHDTIDNTGEHDENSVFEACEKAIVELEKLVRDLHTTFSGVNLFITSDHGFFYKRSKIESFDKVSKDETSSRKKTRYLYSNKKLEEDGILSIDLSYLFKDAAGYVNVPKGNAVFSRQGSGMNYVHGGVLPQEIIIPVIDFKSNRNSEESKKVGITYSGFSSKITNVISYLEFLQDSNVDENNKSCRYLLHFEDEYGNRVSDECTIIANYKNTPVKERFFREKFVFKNIKYDRDKQYYLVIVDEETKEVVDKIRFYIDIAFSSLDF